MGAIDEYIGTFDGEKKLALKRIQRMVIKLVPGAKQAISYGMPTYTLNGRPFIGFDARSKHIGIYPYSSTVLQALEKHLEGYGFSKGALRIPYTKPIPEELLTRIIRERLKYL